MNTQKNPVTLSTVFGRLFIGFGSGIIGTLLLAIILFLSWNIVGDFIQQTTLQGGDSTAIITEGPQAHPLLINFITLAIFLAGLGATITFGALLSVAEEKFSQKSTMLTHVFMGNLTTLIVVLPLYFFAGSTLALESGLLLGLTVHCGLISIFSYLSTAAIHHPRHMIVHLYGALFSITLFVSVINFVLDKNLAILVFLLLPIMLSCTGAATAMVEMFYQWMSKVYGVDFLSTDQKYGQDYASQPSPSDDL